MLKIITKEKLIIFNAAIIILLATIALSINNYIFKFPGNNYFPPNTILTAVILIIIYLGIFLQFGKQNKFGKISLEILYFFCIMAIIALATNAVQYTPFRPIDLNIINFEYRWGIKLQNYMAWGAHYPLFIKLLSFIYDSIAYQMTCFPLIIIITQKWYYIREYYLILLLSTLLGFICYYFWPTLGPASFINSEYFTNYQYATGLKFNQIHHYINPTTNEGGLIAFPSFHVIWAWFCVYLVRDWKFIFILFLFINLLLITSCVLLGWHYLTDLLGSLIIIIIIHSILYSLA